MTFGLPLPTFTMVHVIISLVAIASGYVVVCQFLNSRPLGVWNATFISTTVLTTLTGFLFPNLTLTPAVITGIISSIVLAIALYALYGKHMSGKWRATYVVTAMIALWLNSFVLVVQAFQKVGFFKALAPTQSEPPFLIAQLVLLALVVVLGFLAVRRFRPAM
jgi:high-affinity Fe2+/Pb2+ permease